MPVVYPSLHRFTANSAFMALLAAEMGIEPTKYRKWAVEQINYFLGDNNHDGGCFSFEIGEFLLVKT